MAFNLSLKAVLFIYLFGGLTFIPAVLVLVFVFLPNKRISDKDDGTTSIIDPDFKLGELNELKNLHVKKQGLMTVVSKYNSNVFRGEKDITGLSPLSLDTATFNKLKNNSTFYVNLVNGNLILYSEDTNENKINERDTNTPDVAQNTVHLRNILKVISLKDVIVTIWPPSVTEGSVFTKKSSILIVKRSLYEPESNTFKLPSISDHFLNNNIFFLQTENNLEKEDWYFEILNATKGLDSRSENEPGFIESLGKFDDEPPATFNFNTGDVNKIIALSNANADVAGCKWFNLILSRFLLAYKANNKLENIITKKIKDKLSTINVSFLDEFVINDLQLGDSFPIISNPKVVKMSLEGELEVHFDVLFDSHFVLNISTLVNVLNKTYPIELKLDLKKIQGTMILLFKKPPSNRIWYTFSKTPLLDLEIEPVIVNKSFSYNMVVKTLKGKIIDAFNELLVYPYFEDISYYKVDENFSVYKGGLWDFTNFENYLKEFESPSDLNSFELLQRNKSLNDEFSLSGSKNEEASNFDEETIAKDIDNDSAYSSGTYNNLNGDKKTFRDILKKRTTNIISSTTKTTLSQSDIQSVSSSDSNNTKKYAKKINTWYKKAKKSASAIIDEATNSEPANEDLGDEDVTYETENNGAVFENESQYIAQIMNVQKPSTRSASQENDLNDVSKASYDINFGSILNDQKNPFELYQHSKAEAASFNSIDSKSSASKIDIPRRPLPPLPTDEIQIQQAILASTGNISKQNVSKDIKDEPSERDVKVLKQDLENTTEQNKENFDAGDKQDLELESEENDKEVLNHDSC